MFVRVAALVGVEAGVRDGGGGVVAPEEQLARRVRQRDAAAEHLEVDHVARCLHAGNHSLLTVTLIVTMRSHIF